jgi:hypothetical protein
LHCCGFGLVQRLLCLKFVKDLCHLKKGSELAIIPAAVSAVMLATLQLQLIVSLQLLLTHSHFMLWSNRSVAARSGTQSENAEIVSRSLKHERDALASIDAEGEHVLSICQHSFCFPTCLVFELLQGCVCGGNCRCSLLSVV